MSFGQLVIGPPGSGKTTYCSGMRDFLTAGGRKVRIVNLDPANDNLPEDVAVDVCDLITVEDVMDRLDLGPNGGLVYCLEFVEKNYEWLEARLKEAGLGKESYFLFDCPGQVELYTHNAVMRRLAQRLEKTGVRLVSVHLVDAHYCSDPSKFISVLLTSLSTMIQIELPHVNVLSKIDLIERYGKLAFNLDFYTDVLDLSYLVGRINDDPFLGRFKDLNEKLCELVEDYSLVSFSTLNIQDKESMMRLTRLIDKAGGYLYGDIDSFGSIMKTVLTPDATSYYDNLTVQERYMRDDNNSDTTNGASQGDANPATV
eukprot:Opistho-2@49623